MRVRLSNKFKRDLRRLERQRKDIDRLWRVVDFLVADDLVPSRYSPHRLTGDMAGLWECHIGPDWLLVWRVDAEEIALVRTGSHDDIFA